MVAFQRLSTVPTVPELLRQDRRRTHSVAAMRRRATSPATARPQETGRRLALYAWRAQIASLLIGSELLIVATHLLYRRGLLGPQRARRCLIGADRLIEAAMRNWHALRRAQVRRNGKHGH